MDVQVPDAETTIAQLRAEVARLRSQLSAGVGEELEAERETNRRDRILLRAFMDQGDLLAWLKDARGHIVYANRNWLQLFGLNEANRENRFRAVSWRDCGAVPGQRSRSAWRPSNRTRHRNRYWPR